MTPEQTANFNEIYKKYNKFLYNICKRYSKETEKSGVEDILQDTWVNVITNIDKIDFTSPFLKTYITKIAMNTSMMYSKNAKNRIYYSNKISLSASNYESENWTTFISNIEKRSNLVCELKNNELYTHIEYYLQTASKQDRQIFDFYINDCKSISEIALELNIKKNVVYYSIRKTRELIKNIL